MSTQIKTNAESEHWDRMAYSADNCSLTQALAILGDKWTIPLMREAFFGLRRFSQFEAALGCARNLLSARLLALIQAGLLDHVDYQEPGQRRRREYRLTEKGRALLPLLISLVQWGDRWAVDPKGPPIMLSHKGCGGQIRVDVVCDRGHGDLSSSDITVSAGPGARRVR
jgi:DNA-binding HxlR family transcriptional regulator